MKDQPSNQSRQIALAQGLFFLNAAIWLFFTYLFTTDQVTPGDPISSWVIPILMVGNALAMLVCGIGLRKRNRFFYFLAVAVIGINVFLTVTDQVGLFDYITLLSAVGVRSSDGKLMWRYDKAANDTANITTPVVFDNRVFVTSAYNTGGAQLQLRAENGEVRADEVYFTRDMMNHHGGVVFVGGYIYGYSNAILTCLEAATGRVQWRDRSVGKGSLTYADGRLYVLGESNTVGLVDASPAGYVERGRFQIADHGWPSWAHPVVAGGRLYLRNQGVLAAHDIGAR